MTLIETFISLLANNDASKLHFKNTFGYAQLANKACNFVEPWPELIGAFFGILVDGKFIPETRLVELNDIANFLHQLGFKKKN